MDSLGLKIDYQAIAGKNMLVLSGFQGKEPVKYQLEMLASNEITGFLKLETREKNNELKLYYDITGLVTLENYFKRQKISTSEFTMIMNRITSVLNNCTRFLLDEGSFVLDKQYLYINPRSKEIGMLYLPLESEVVMDCKFKAFLQDLLINTADIAAEDNYLQRVLRLLKEEDFHPAGFGQALLNLNTNGQVPMESCHICEENSCAGQDITGKGGFLAGNPSVTKQQEDNDGTKRSNTRLKFLYVAALGCLMGAIYSGYKDKLNFKDFEITGFDYLVAGIGALALSIILGVLIYIRNRRRDQAIEAEKMCQGLKMVQNLTAQETACTRTDFISEKVNNYVAIPNGSSSLNYDPPDETTLLDWEESGGVPRLQAVEGNDMIKLDKPSVLIGRNKDACDHIIANRSIGRAHAEIRCIEDKYFVVDMDSTNGTFLNGDRLIGNKQHELRENDKISFAKLEYIFTISKIY